MTNTTVSPELLAGSVISVPPLARKADYSLDRDGNRKILAHMAAGGVTTALYGGNANLYNMSVSEFGTMLDQLEEVAPAGTWLIPSIGPDYGKATDQLAVLKGRDLPTAMVLPLNFPITSAGVATGLRRIAELYGQPIIAYVKSTDYISPAHLAAVVRDGAICAIKYAVVRKDPADDPFLAELVQNVDTSMIVSGIGERPVIAHMTRFKLQSFTSGSVCIAPAMSAAILRALKAGRVDEAMELRTHFIALEDLRDGHSPLRVLHAAVAEAGIADTGPMLPFLSNIDDTALLATIRTAATTLRDLDAAHLSSERVPA